MYKYTIRLFNIVLHVTNLPPQCISLILKGPVKFYCTNKCIVDFVTM